MSYLDLTTLVNVKLVRTGSGFSNDTLLGSYIKLVSMRAAQVLGKFKDATYFIKAEEYTEYFDVLQYGENTFRLAGWPITVAPVVYNDTDTPRAYADAIDSDVVLHNPATGVVTIETDIEPGARALKMTYTGGMGATVSAIMTAYPELRAFIDMQVWHLYEKRWGMVNEDKPLMSKQGPGFWIDGLYEFLVTMREGA